MPLDVASTRTRDERAAEIPAVDGHGNARSVAGIHTILANWRCRQRQAFPLGLWLPQALEQQIEGPCLVMRRMPARFGMGWWVLIDHHLDMDARTTFAYTANKM